MSIFLNEDSRIVVCGITGKQGSFHTEKMLEYGTKVVAGVTPGKAGQEVLGVPVFNSVKDAVNKTCANVSIIFVPAAFAAASIMESADAGIKLCVCITEGLPVLDMVKVKSYLRDKEMILLGPNCPGLIVPGVSKVGIMPGNIHTPGKIGVISRSGTLTYEVVKVLGDVGLGESLVIGIGGDPIHGLNYIDCLKEFNKDDNTDAVVLCGEIGGNDEEKAADWIADNMNKPVVAFVAGKTAPKGKRMGHAGAIINGASSTAEAKMKYLEDRGIAVAQKLEDIGIILKNKL